MAEPGKLTLSGVLWGLVIPLIIGIVIVAFPAILRPALDSWFPPATMDSPASPYAFLTVIFTHGFATMVVFGVPLFLGLNWSKYAGGACGFITGTLYYVAFAGYNIEYSRTAYGAAPPYNLYADPSFIGNYIVGAILVGYIAGALNNKSFHFKRKLGAALTAALTVGIFSFILSYTVSFAKDMIQDVGFALFTALLPMIILGIIVPIISRITAGGELWHP